MFLYLALLFLTTASYGFCEDVEPGDVGPDKHIIGGKDAPEGSRPFQVSLGTGDGKQHSHFCGGAILDEKWVVTAAHCTKPFSKTKIRVKAGTTKLSSGGTLHEIEKIINHEKYDITKFNYDISLIKIKDKFKFNDNVKAVPLPKENIGGGISCIVSGWGYTEQNGKNLPDKLQMVTVNTLTNKDCLKTRLSRLQKEIPLTRNQICTYKDRGQGICQGDLGGPLTCNGELVGLVSYNIPCARGVPDVYTRVYQFLDWIRKNKK